MGTQTPGQRTQRQRFVGLKPQMGQAEQLEQRAERRERHERPLQQQRHNSDLIALNTLGVWSTEEGIAPTLSHPSVLPQPQLVFCQTELGIRLVT